MNLVSCMAFLPHVVTKVSKSWVGYMTILPSNMDVPSPWCCKAKYKTLINPTIKNCSCGMLRLEGVWKVF